LARALLITSATVRSDLSWLVAVLLAQASMVAGKSRPSTNPSSKARSKTAGLRNNALYVSIAALSANAVIAFLLYNNGHLPVSAFFFILLSLLLVLAYSIPPLRFINRGFGEFILAAQLAYVVPSIGYILQSDETHRFLLVTIPLTFLAFAYFIIMDFPAFASDTKYNRSTFLTGLGWERVVPLHHLFILLAYLFFLSLPIFGLSLALLWPAFLTLPFALFQIYLSLALGAPPTGLS
jgi:1,4-dihydroxy-2-naphthoate octaprenyltransferase